MTSIRLKVEFSFDHCHIPAGTVISVPAEIARDLAQRGVAEMAEPQHAVIEPQETRMLQSRNRGPRRREQ